MAGLVRTPLLPILLLLISIHFVQGSYHTPYLNPGFHFDYAKPNQPLTIPVTSQCEKIHLKWTRSANDTGLLPVAPYFLQVYSSASSTPYFVEAGFGPTFDWDVPFAPNTLYQICMFDINGVSGGCQQAYSMITNTTVDKPFCNNVTAPSALSVSARVPTGAMSLYSYIDQCKSLSVTPSSGTPPFTLTIAPSNHPPYNITSKTIDTISWQVSLPRGSQFYISLESSEGSMWASGPLTVGGFGQDNCLASGSRSKDDFEKVLIGSTVGSIVFGIAAGIIGCLVFLRLRRRHRAPSQADFGDKFSHSSPFRSLRAASSFGGTSLAPSSSLGLASPTLSSIPLAPATPPTRLFALPESSPPPRQQSPPRRPPRGHRSVEPYVIPPSDISADSILNRYPADVKRPLRSSEITVTSGDDTSSLASSSTGSQSNSLSRALSTQSRAPTYVSRTTRLRDVVNAINETDVPDLPPEYGHHTTDTSLNYAPSVLSSGNRF